MSFFDSQNPGIGGLKELTDAELTALLVLLNNYPFIKGIIAGTNISVDNTDPLNPIVSSLGGGDVNSVNGKTGDVVLVASDIETDNGLGGSNIEEDLLILDERIMTLENTPSFNPTNFTDKTNDYRYFAEVDDVETVVTRYSRTTFIRQTATGLWADRTTLTYS